MNTRKEYQRMYHDEHREGRNEKSRQRTKERREITQEEVRDIFNCIDGELIYKKTMNSRAPIGKRFGSLNPQGYIRGVVIFARGECPKWVRPMFQYYSEVQK